MMVCSRPSLFLADRVRRASTVAAMAPNRQTASRRTQPSATSASRRSLATRRAAGRDRVAADGGTMRGEQAHRAGETSSGTDADRPGRARAYSAGLTQGGVCTGCSRRRARGRWKTGWARGEDPPDARRSPHPGPFRGEEKGGRKKALRGRSVRSTFQVMDITPPSTFLEERLAAMAEALRGASESAAAEIFCRFLMELFACLFGARFSDCARRAAAGEGDEAEDADAGGRDRPVLVGGGLRAGGGDLRRLELSRRGARAGTCGTDRAARVPPGGDAGGGGCRGWRAPSSARSICGAAVGRRSGRALKKAMGSARRRLPYFITLS